MVAELIRFVGVTICALILNGARLVIWDLLKHGEEDVRQARLRGDGIGKMLGLRPAHPQEQPHDR